ncbi:hypothetical protein G7B40_025260 [Aetokthonos hydrillicola Thurmond2011]|jgi:hypothetical protein|uniref:Uncharacterized protein n=1 Tax=Aetokthonos hydrillicola Thurmond2011 TaxID=2712845 RepID=A0AAP5IAA5_9CYAN|nr:hypothetical protein [Aetokthonos hydrillicola]MBO3458433.1 hypothetical protein [Aetokthonos hydrillicola CCALA 1050]MBW4586240.1 hypothetical protein [Aetokthonos hydrillicola CCALA 1050]MDR9897847.1 hypothetical protein [Aetokthonos hydrillicola Thurmond2011]
MLNTKIKNSRQPLRILSSGQSVSNPIAIVAVSSLVISILSLFIQIANYGATSSLSRKEAPSLVQLVDGSTVNVKALDPKERSAEVIKKFVSDSMVKMFNWDGLMLSNSRDGEVVTKADKGVEIKLKKGIGRVTTKAWEAAFALTEKEDFRASFLKKLAELTPPGAFSGNIQTSLVPRYVSEPRKIREGKWQVDIVATLVTFSKEDNAGSGIGFNKTVTVQAISTPQFPPETTEIAKKIYQTRKSGLEITEITDLDLQK